MKLIIHGNDITSSRNFFFEEKTKIKSFISLNGDALTFDILFQALENQSFFEEKKSILIENYFGKNKTGTIEFKQIAQYLEKEKNADVIFWENSEISKSALPYYKSFLIKMFSFPQSIFLLLDNIKPNNSRETISIFNQLKKNIEPEIILFMIVRQLRILLSISMDQKIEETKRLAPWQIAKFKKQLTYFSPESLRALYGKLYKLDLSQKTGTNAIEISKGIDFFLSTL